MGASRFSAEKFLSHTAEYSVGQPFCAVFLKFSGSEELYGQWGGVSRFSVEKTFSHSAEKFLGGIVYCFINFRYRKMLGIREGGNTIFRRKSFVSQCRKIS